MIKILKRVIPIFAFAVLISSSAMAQMKFQEIKTESEWERAMAEANSTGKLIFLDIYATWCGPCKMLESDIYPDIELGKYYNSHFINLKMDGETEFGRLKVMQFGLRAYPTMYYLSSSEDLLSQVVGVKQAPELVEFGIKVVEGSGKLIQYKSDFAADKLSAEELMEYRTLLLEFEQEAQSNEVAAKIFPTLSEEDILNPLFKSIVMSARSDLDGKLFKLMKENEEKIKGLWTVEEIGKLYANIFDTSLKKAVAEKDEVYRDRIIKELIPIYLKDTPEGIKRAEFITNKLYFANTGEWNSFGEMVNAEYDTNHKGDDKFLYGESYEIVNNYSQSPDAAKIALGLMDSAVAINPSFDNLILESYLNGVNGNVEKARTSLTIVEGMTLSDEQKKILNEIQNIVEQAGK